MRRFRSLAFTAASAALLLIASAAPSAADPGPDQAAPAGYRTPPPELLQIVDAPMPLRAEIGPDESTLLLLEWRVLTSLEQLAQDELRLAGVRFSPATNGPSRSVPFSAMSLLDIASGERRPVAGLPATPHLTNVRWSPSGRHVSFTQTRTDGIELWVVDVDSASARRLTEPVLSMLHGVAPAWIDDRSLVLTMVPQDRGLPPRRSAVPRAPVVQENTGTTKPARTYQDLLSDAHDEALFEHYLRSQLARVDLAGRVTPLGEPALFGDFAPSPDGRFVLVEHLHRPFSYLVPASRFPMRAEVWTIDGEPLRQIVDRPLQESIPIAFGSVPTGPRTIAWRQDAAASVAWVEALDGGDAGREVPFRDQLVLLDAPFRGDGRVIARLPLRFDEIVWGRDDLAMVSTWEWPTRTEQLVRVRPGDGAGADGAGEPEILFDFSFEDLYADPGDWATTYDARGREVLQISEDGGSLFLLGDGDSPEGRRPFVDRYDLARKTTERLFHSTAPYYERPQELLGTAGSDDFGRYLLTQRESRTEPPNFFVRDLRENQVRRLTNEPHPTPQLAGVTKELLKYERKDGVQLTATLYLPPHHDPGEDGPLPTVLWAYPREFKSADAAGQVDDSPYRFARVSWWSPLVWLARGYAVLDDPKMPIVGEDDDEPNDRFIEQLVSSAEAAIDEVVRRGVADRDRIAIGGHSYGAFMTANLLAHSDLFAAGVARSGAYNRTLTPFGFQAEERTLWQAPEVYFAMSPFMHADQVDEPLLLIHGAADNNSGTFPMQSERFYNALRGHGATARLVMLPLESHSYRARESVLHALWETDAWLEQHVKNRTAPAPNEETTPSIRVEDGELAGAESPDQSADQ